MTHSPMPSFIQWPIHPMTHSPMPSFIQWLIHSMTHSPMSSFIQWPIHPMTPFIQWSIQAMPPFSQWLIHLITHSANDSFTMCCSANKERGSDCSMQYASTPAHMCEEVAATDVWCRALCLLAACIKTIPVSDTMLSEDVTMTSFTQWLIYPMALFINSLIYSMTHSPNDSFTNAPLIQWPIHPKTHSPMPSFIQGPIHPMNHSPNAPIHSMTHSPNDSFRQCPHSANGLIHQWLHSFKDPFTQ